VTADGLGAESGSKASVSASRPTLAPDSLTRVRAEWITFYDAHYRRVVRFLMYNGASQADAQDAVQEAFVESWALMSSDPCRWEAINGKTSWIRTVALRRYLRPPGSRQRPLTAGGEVPDLAGPGPGHEELTIQTQLVLRALRALDKEARAVMAFDLDGIPTADIACALDITQQRVRDVKKKARTALMRELADNMTSEGRKS
jgi:RNA polymerase sigma factor (sigma-70 family)